MEDNTSIIKTEWDGFVQWKDGDLLGMVHGPHGYYAFEPGSPHIEDVIDELCIEIATGTPERKLFSTRYRLRVVGGVLGAAKRLHGKALKGERLLHYFTIAMEINPVEDADWVYRCTSLSMDRGLYAGALSDEAARGTVQ